MANRILVVDDEKLIVKGLRFSLEQDGMEVDCAYDGQEAIDLVKQGEYDLVLLDVMLPVFDGFEVCQQIREFSDVPIIMITAKSDDMDKILGLDMGADDYISKPFRVRELISRIKSVLRRYRRGEGSKAAVSLGPVRVNVGEVKVWKNGEEVILTALEYRLLLTFLNHPGQTLIRGQLLEGIWDVAGDFVNDNTLTVYIKRLREKIEEDPQNPVMLRTIRGLGYKLGE